jgi:hypothetical protein
MSERSGGVSQDWGGYGIRSGCASIGKDQRMAWAEPGLECFWGSFLSFFPSSSGCTHIVGVHKAIMGYCDYCSQR